MYASIVEKLEKYLFFCLFSFIRFLHLNVCKAEGQKYFSFYLDRINPNKLDLSPHWHKFFVFTEQSVLKEKLF